MTTHELKLDIRYFDDVKSGKKNFEIRKNDRDFKVGDTLILEAFRNGHYVAWETAGPPTDYGQWESCEKKWSDFINVKVVELENHKSLSELGYYNRLDFLGIDPSAVLKVLKEYFGTDKIPDNYVLLGIEVEK